MKKWLVIVLCAPFVLSACKQGLGDRCEVNEDCSSGACSGAMPRVCVTENNKEMTDIDGSLPCDAPCVDAAVDGR